MTFHSEFGEDKWIAENLPLPAEGNYVDVGCGHPVIGSNTAFLRDRGWRGTGIDANLGYASAWTRGTFIQAFVSDFPIVPFAFKEVSGHSRVELGAPMVGACRLDRLISERPDFLSLDLEGHEFNALLSLSRDLLPPIIVSEYNTHGIGEDPRVLHYLIVEGYEVVHQTIANHIFYRK